jgi:hypothetical protein
MYFIVRPVARPFENLTGEPEMGKEIYLDRIALGDIIIGNRIRKDMGDIEGLADNIREQGLLQPIAIDFDNHLIDGGRRLAAMRLLGNTHIAAYRVDCDVELGEVDANEMHKHFNISECVAIAERRAAKLKGRVGNPNLKSNSADSGGIANKGETRDLVFKLGGFGGHTTYQSAKYVVDNGTDELISAMNNKVLSIDMARKFAKLPHIVQESTDFTNKDAVKTCLKNYGIDTSKNGSPAVVVLPVVAKKAKEAKQSPTNNVDFYEEGSTLSAGVLSYRAITAIRQIGKNDPNALAELDRISDEILKLRNLINGEAK